MITIIVGVPGAGKTLYAMSRLREEYSDRTVYFHNIPGVNVDGWKELQDPYKWHENESGAVCLVDEAHEVFPKRDYKIKEPEHIEAAATLRHRGHDLVLVTQHPVDLDIFLRRRCARFIYIKKPLSKGDYANIFVWGEYNDNYKDEKEQQKADSFQFKYPKEAFGTYKSAVVHTSKRYMPKAAKRAFAILAAGIVLFLVFGYYLLSRFTDNREQVVAEQLPSSVATVPGAAVMTGSNYIQQFLPRVSDLPYTAPIYDQLTQAQTYPKMVCVASEARCQCYTQQATRLHISESVCRQAVQDGIFDFTRTENGSRNNGPV